MEKNSFRDREQAEEAVYFHQQDAKLIEKLRAKAKLEEIAQALSDKLRVDNPELLKQIVDLGITPDTAAAFLLLPLIQVAWGGGQVTRHEHDTVLGLGAQRGVAPGSASYAQIEKWLADRPSDALFDSSLEAIQIGLTVLPPEERKQRIEEILHTCTQVAGESGVLKRLHLRSADSGAEHSILDVIRSKLSGTPGNQSGKQS